MSDKCPKCGSPRMLANDSRVQFACGAAFTRIGAEAIDKAPFMHVWACGEIAELTAALAARDAEIAELKEKLATAIDLLRACRALMPDGMCISGSPKTLRTEIGETLDYFGDSPRNIQLPNRLPGNQFPNPAPSQHP